MPAYKDKTGRWRYRFVKNGTRYSGSTPKDANTKRAAEELARKHADSIISGLKRGERAPFVRDFAASFLDHQRPRTKPLTQRQQKATLENYVVPVIGHLRLDEVGRAQIDQLTTEWCKTLAPKTVNARLGTLRRMLAIAAEWGIIPGVPKVQFLKLSKKHPRFLSDQECADHSGRRGQGLPRRPVARRRARAGE